MNRSVHTSDHMEGMLLSWKHIEMQQRNTFFNCEQTMSISTLRIEHQTSQLTQHLAEFGAEDFKFLTQRSNLYSTNI
jgi:hypothetical protein